MIILGLTGSIAMGKSTTAAMFRDAGIPVWDADAAVHAAYAAGGAAVAPVAALIPQALVDDALDREALRVAIAADPALLNAIERIVHPIVAEDRARFIEDARRRGERAVMLDIPLLFESKGHAGVDKVVVVTCPPDMQRSRALARPGMTPERFDSILARQIPDAEKRARADWIIDTGIGMDAARARVADILAEL